MQMPIFLLPPSAFKLLVFILAHEERGKLVVTLTDVAARLSMRRETIREAINHLTSLGVIKWRPGTALDPGDFFVARSLKSTTASFKILREVALDIKEPGMVSSDGKSATREQAPAENPPHPLAEKPPIPLDAGSVQHSLASSQEQKKGPSGGKSITLPPVKEVRVVSTEVGSTGPCSDGSTGATLKGGHGGKSARRKIRQQSASLLTPDEEVLLLKDASKILGVTVGIGGSSDFGRRVRMAARSRIREGYTREHLLDACRYAAKNWSNGVRFSGFKNLMLVWSRYFEEILATKGEAGKRVGTGEVFGSKERWVSDTKRKLEERGEKW